MNLNTRAILKQILQGRYFNKALDLGCGEGYYADILKNHAKWLVGIDHNLGRLSVAKEFAGYDEVVFSEVQEYQIPSDTEAVFILEVLEHLSKSDGHNLLLKLRNIPFVFITTPAAFHRFTFRNYHQSLWTEGELQEYGFKTQKFNYGFPVFREGIIALRE